jgi:trehalose-phosphatase
MTPADDWVEAVLIAYRAGRSLALLFDYDGTLAPIAPKPVLATLSEGVRKLLRELARRDDVTIGIISGRGMADVSAMVGVEGLYYAGCGGAEIDLLGVRVDAPLSLKMREVLGAAEREIRNDLARFPGVWVEPKRHGFTVHYRGAAPSTAQAFHGHLGRLMTPIPELRHENICQAYEVGPADGWDKAIAVARILATAPHNAIPVYFGDSENDLPGMAVVSGVGGLTVAIGETVAHAARYRLDSPEVLHADLYRLSASLNRISITDKSVAG